MNVKPINYQTEWLVSEADGRQHVTSTLKLVQEDFHICAKVVVELGCGIGTNLHLFLPCNKVIGLEGMPAAVARAQESGLDVRQVDLEGPIPLDSDATDVVLCIDVLEHLMDPLHCVHEAWRSLRRGGHFVVNVPNHFDWKARLRILRGSGIDSQLYFPTSPVWEYPHVRFFSRTALDAMVGEAGFQLVKDYSSRYVSFPKAHWWRALGARAMMEGAQGRWPDLFSAGFFAVYRK